MPAKARRPARAPKPRGRAKGKGRSGFLGPLLLLGLLLFAGGVYFGGRIKNHGGKSLPPATAGREQPKPPRAKSATAAGRMALGAGGRTAAPGAIERSPGGNTPLPPAGGHPA